MSRRAPVHSLAFSVFFEAITTGGVTYQDKPWHRECFLCIGCRKQLSGQRFTSRENYPYCLECFSNLYAKKCVGCTKPITSESPAAAFERMRFSHSCLRSSPNARVGSVK